MTHHACVGEVKGQNNLVDLQNDVVGRGDRVRCGPGENTARGATSAHNNHRHGDRNKGSRAHQRAHPDGRHNRARRPSKVGGTTAFSGPPYAAVHARHDRRQPGVGRTCVTGPLKRLRPTNGKRRARRAGFETYGRLVPPEGPTRGRRDAGKTPRSASRTSESASFSWAPRMVRTLGKGRKR